MPDKLDWIQVGELADGMKDGFMLPRVDDLAAKTMDLFFEDGAVIRHTFADNASLTWEVVAGDEKGTAGKETYRATNPRPDIYFVDFIKQGERATSVSLVIDLATQMATVVIGTMPTEAETRKDLYRRATEGEELTAVTVQFLRAGIGREANPDERSHRPTSDLVGKRVKYVYSETEAYEHIYLNENLYTWHCLVGLEKGLADTDRCHHIKITDELYLFTWWEKIIPTMGIVLIDLNQMKTTGKLFGFESNDFSQLANAAVGAHATLLNITQYD